MLALVAIVLLAGIITGGLLLRARRHAATISPSSTETAIQPLTQTPVSSDLDAAIAEADRLDPGWRWDQLWAKRTAVPFAENSARIVTEAGKLLPRGPADVPGFIDRAGEDRLNEQQIAELNAWLEPRAASVRVVLTLADRPRGRYEIKVAPNFISTLLPDVQTTRQLENVLKVEAVRRAEAGNAGGLEVFRAMLNTARSIGDEPFLISQIIRSVDASIAIRSLEQTLARTAASEETLSAAQKLLNDEAGHNSLLVAWRGERATLFGLYEGVDTGKISLEQIRKTLSAFGTKGNWPAEAGPGSAGLRAARAWQLRFMTELVEVAKKPTQEQASALVKLRIDSEQAPAVVAMFLNIFGDNDPIANIPKSFRRREALLHSTIAALAAERFRLQKGRWPLEAKEMDASLGGPLPTDPFDGNPLRFRQTDDGLIVYSIGPNGRDDGGDLGDRGDEARDIGFRLWFAEKRR